MLSSPLPPTRPSCARRRLVEDLWRVDVNRVARVGVHRARVCGLLIQIEARCCSDLVEDGARITLSLPGLPTASRTWRLVPVSQARSGVPDFARSCSWWLIGNDGRRYRHLYFCTSTGECGTRIDLNLKYGCQRWSRRKQLHFQLLKTRYALETCQRHRKCADQLTRRLQKLGRVAG